MIEYAKRELDLIMEGCKDGESKNKIGRAHV